MDQSVGNKEDWLECAKLLEKGMKDGVVVPLSMTVFGSDKAEEAFRLDFYCIYLIILILVSCLPENISEKF
jgi:hypothetical protein